MTEHPDETASLPQLIIFPEFYNPIFPFSFVPGQFLEIFSLLAKHIRRQGNFKEGFLIRRAHGCQDPGHLQGFIRFEEIAHAVKDARDPEGSQGFLNQVGLEGSADLQVRAGVIEIRPVRRNPREGWAEDARRLAGLGDVLVWPEFANEGDNELVW